MQKIEKAGIGHLATLAELARTTMTESHAAGAPTGALEDLIERFFNDVALGADLQNPANEYYLMFQNAQAIGYSKIICSATHPLLPSGSFTKLDKLFFLKTHYGQNFGQTLFDFNLELSKQRHENGMWLFVWKENHRAVQFYQKNHFEIIGEHDYTYNDTFSRPNHLMLLTY